MMKPFLWLGLWVISALLLSCSSDNFIYQNSFDSGCWSVSDTLDLSFEKKDDEKLQIFLDVSQDYAYQNLYVKLFVKDPQGKQSEILLNDTLFTPAGEWLVPQRGTESRISYTSPGFLPREGGTYNIRLIQFMREDELCGINKLGIGLAN